MLRTFRQGWFMVALIGAAVAGCLQPSTAEAAIEVEWSGPNDGDGNMNDLVISFAPIATSALTMIEGEAYSHNQGSHALQYSILVRLDNLWVEIDSWNHADSNKHLLSERTAGGPLTFALGLVDGLWLRNIYPVNFGYHDLAQTKFVFDNPTDPGQPVLPEPASLLIWGAGAAGIAAVRCRRQRGRLPTTTG